MYTDCICMYINVSSVKFYILYTVKCVYVLLSILTDSKRSLHLYLSDELGRLIFLKTHDLYDEQSTPLTFHCINFIVLKCGFQSITFFFF
jgi:hypothetical protein